MNSQFEDGQLGQACQARFDKQKQTANPLKNNGHNLEPTPRSGPDIMARLVGASAQWGRFVRQLSDTGGFKLCDYITDRQTDRVW